MHFQVPWVYFFCYGSCQMIQNNRYDDLPKGLLAFAPFFLVAASLIIGIGAGFIVVILIFLLTPILYLLRKLILSEQRLAVVMIVSVSAVLLTRLLIDAEAYSLGDKLGLFFPLLLMNSLVLSLNESIFTMPDFKSAMSKSFNIGIAILLFFVIVGFLREMLNDFSILTSPAGYFFLFGFLYAAFNFLNKKRLKL